MRKNFYPSSLALILALALLAVAGDAQTRRTRPTRSGATAPAADRNALPLPASDAVVFVDLNRLLTDAIPRALASDPAKLSEVNADIEQFKAQTGIDARLFDRLAVGSRFASLPGGKVKFADTVALAHGTFDPAVLVAAAKLAAKGPVAEQKFGGKSIYIFSIQDRVKLFGLLSLRVGELALTVLDEATIAVGEPSGVRAAVSAAAGRGRVSPEMVTLARQNPNAIVGFGGRVPASVTKDLDLGNAQISKSVASIRQFYGSLGTTATGFDLLTVLRTMNAQDAKDLSGTVGALKQFAPLFLSRLSGERARIAQKAVDSLRITAQGPEVQMRLEVPETDIAALVRAF